VIVIGPAFNAGTASEPLNGVLDLDLESNRQTPRRDITPMEMKGGTTEDDA